LGLEVLLEQVVLLAVQVYQVQRLASHHLVAVVEEEAVIVQMLPQLQVAQVAARLVAHRKLL